MLKIDPAGQLLLTTVIALCLFSEAHIDCVFGPASAQVKSKLPSWKSTEMEALELAGGAREHKLKEALDEARQTRQADGYPESECLFELGVYFTDIGKTAQAEEYFSQAAAIKTAGMQKILTTAGPIPGSLPAYSDAKQEREGKTHDLANCLSWLGRAYLNEKKYDEAEQAFKRALDLLDTSKDPEHESISLPDTLLRAARVERLLNHVSEAQKMEERARLILRKRHLE